MAMAFRKNKITVGIAGLLLSIVFSLVAPNANAVTAEDSFPAGNRLFRDDLYWAALLRYRQASEAGMDTPLLHYNTGVAHYRAGQYGRAHQALLKASKSSQLRVISHYNLGLNSYAAGNNDEALRWLRRARDQQQSPKIRALAIRAIARLRREQRALDPAVLRASIATKKKNFTELELYSRAGVGYDTNVYRAPSTRYIDRANRNQPIVVDPVVQKGFYYPVRLGAKYSVNSFEHESFLAVTVCPVVFIRIKP